MHLTENYPESEITMKPEEIEQLLKDRERLNWLERFLQMGGASIFASPTCQAHEGRDDDTKETYWNHPFHLGMQITVDEELGESYKWEEFSNGAKGIRGSIDAAMIKQGEYFKRFNHE